MTATLSIRKLEPRRLLTAFALTPLLSGFYPAIFLAEPMTMPIGLVVAYASALLFGLPLLLMFDRRQWRTWWHFTIGGAICAVPAMMVYGIVGTPEHLPRFGPLAASAVLGWGASSGMVFWLLGIAGDTPVSWRSLFDTIPSKH
jgi:hypothetical protein